MGRCCDQIQAPFGFSAVRSQVTTTADLQAVLGNSRATAENAQGLFTIGVWEHYCHSSGCLDWPQAERIHLESVAAQKRPKPALCTQARTRKHTQTGAGDETLSEPQYGPMHSTKCTHLPGWSGSQKRARCIGSL